MKNSVHLYLKENQEAVLHGDSLPKNAATSLSPEQRFWGISVLQRAQD
jgi:hypothetical protein